MLIVLIVTCVHIRVSLPLTCMIYSDSNTSTDPCMMSLMCSATPVRFLVWPETVRMCIYVQIFSLLQQPDNIVSAPR